MAASIHAFAGRHGRRSGERDLREPRFQRSPWAQVTCGERQNLQVTTWEGVKAVVIALSFTGGNPEDIRISIEGARLMITGTVRSRFVRHAIDLPCPVEARPIRIDDDKGTIFVLLQKAQR